MVKSEAVSVVKCSTASYRLAAGCWLDGQL